MQGADNDGREDQEWLPTREIRKVHEPDAALEIETSVCACARVVSSDEKCFFLYDFSPHSSR